MQKKSKAILSIMLAFAMFISAAMPVFATESVSLDEATYDLDNELPVIPIEIVSKIAVTKYPTKILYQLNEELNLEGGELTITYDDNSTKVVPLSSAIISGFDSSTIGSKQVVVTYEGKVTEFSVVVEIGIAGRSLILEDALYVNAFMVKPQESDSNDYKIVWTHRGISHTVQKKDMVVNGSYLTVAMPIAIKEISDDIKVELYKNAETTPFDTKYYSARGYCEQVLRSSTSKQSLKDLVKCLLDYGTYMQKLKNYNYDSEHPSNENFSFGDKYYQDIVINDEYDHSITYNGTDKNSFGLSVSGYSTILDTITNARIYFLLADGKSIGDYTFTCAGKNLATTYSEYKNPNTGDLVYNYYVDLPGYAAKYTDLARDLVVTNKNVSGTLDVSYSIMYYAYSCKDQTDKGLLVRAMFEYCRLAKINFGVK